MVVHRVRSDRDGAAVRGAGRDDAGPVRSLESLNSSSTPACHAQLADGRAHDAEMTATITAWLGAATAVVFGVIAIVQAGRANKSARKSAEAEVESAVQAARAADAGERAAAAAEKANELAAPKIKPRWKLEWIQGGRMKITNRTGETAEDIKISAPEGGVGFGNTEQLPQCDRLLNGESFECVVGTSFDRAEHFLRSLGRGPEGSRRTGNSGSPRGSADRVQVGGDRFVASVPRRPHPPGQQHRMVGPMRAASPGARDQVDEPGQLTSRARAGENPVDRVEDGHLGRPVPASAASTSRRYTARCRSKGSQIRRMFAR